jgi:hypothetical protein
MVACTLFRLSSHLCLAIKLLAGISISNWFTGTEVVDFFYMHAAWHGLSSFLVNKAFGMYVCVLATSWS